MCRWQVFFGEEPCLLEDILISPKHGLFNQVHEHYLPGLLEASEKDNHLGKTQEEREITLRDRLFNIDGVGIGYYTNTLAEFDVNVDGPRPTLFKSVRPPLNNPSLRSVCANTHTTCLFGHIRMAESAVTETNTHPFAFGRHLFQHNGSIGNFKFIHRALLQELSPAAWKNIQGTTDSEVMAAVFFTYLTSKNPHSPDAFTKTYPMNEMKGALFQTLATIERLQHALPSTEAFDPSSLNVAITNGEALLTLRYRPHPTESPPSLYYSTSAGVLLNRRFVGHPDGKEESSKGKKEAGEHGRHVVVGSEPSTFDKKAWTLIPKNSVLFVETLGGDVVVEKVPGW